MATLRWLLRRLEAQGKAECGMRVLDGTHHGLTHRWRHGVAKLAPGLLTFVPYLPPGIRIRNRFALPVVVQVQRISTEPRPASGLRDLWSLNPESMMFEIETASAVLEWAVIGRQAKWVTSRVRGHDA